MGQEQNLQQIYYHRQKGFSCVRRNHTPMESNLIAAFSMGKRTWKHRNFHKIKYLKKYGCFS